jgi:hypothetical protein
MSNRTSFPDCEYLKMTDRVSPDDVFVRCTHPNTDEHLREHSALRRICKTCILYRPTTPLRGPDSVSTQGGEHA